MAWTVRVEVPMRSARVSWVMPAPLRARRMLAPMLLMSSIASPCFGNMLLIQPCLVPRLPDVHQICKILPKTVRSAFPTFVGTGSRNIFPIFLLVRPMASGLADFGALERQQDAACLEAHTHRVEGCVWWL